jgi:hypothetical protein
VGLVMLVTFLRENEMLWRAVSAFLVVLFLWSAALTEACDADPVLSNESVTPVVMPVPKGSLPNMSTLKRIQDPYCPGGTGSCGQICQPRGGSNFSCSPSFVPCYDQNGGCACRYASKC